MPGAGGLSPQATSALANQQATLNRNNTWSPIYGGTEWTYGGGTQSGTAPGAPNGYYDTHGDITDPRTGQPGSYNSSDPLDPRNSFGGMPQSGTPNMWTETQTLSPYLQQRFDLANQLQGRLAGDMQGFDNSIVAPNFDPN
jgi:hypothetical protein